MQYCANGMCGSLGAIARALEPGRRRPLRGLGAHAEAYYGRGCNPQGVPTPDEMKILEPLALLETNWAAAKQRCSDIWDARIAELTPSSPTSESARLRASKAGCMGGAGQAYGPQVQMLRDQLEALCVAKSQGLMTSASTETDLQPLPDETLPELEPLPEKRGLSTGIKLAIGAGGLLLMVGGIYLVTKQ